MSRRDMPVKLLILSATTLLAAQTVTPVSLNPDFFTMIEHLTLNAALIIAVVMLWKSNAEKDKMLLENSKVTTAAALESAKSSAELRKAIENLISIGCSRTECRERQSTVLKPKS